MEPTSNPAAEPESTTVERDTVVPDPPVPDAAVPGDVASDGVAADGPVSNELHDVVAPAIEPAAEEPAIEPAPNRFALDDAEPDAPEVPDLGAVDTAPVRAGQATSLDLPSLDLPFPAEPPRPAAPTPSPAGPTQTAASWSAGQAGGDYAGNLARESYGETAPTPPYAAAPSAPYAEPPYAEPQYAEPQYSQPPLNQPPLNQPYQPQGQYGQPAYGQPASGQLVPASQLSPADEQVWASGAHWSSLVLSLVGVPFLGPLLVMLIQGPKSARVRANAVESLNFDLTMIIGMLISFVLMFVVIGLITAPIIGLLWFVLKIVAAVQTAGGQDYRYPFNVRMVK